MPPSRRGLPGPVPRPARTRREPAQRRAEVLDHAAAVFAEHGFAGARFADVAARAGLTKGAVYHYFETKEQLFEAVIEERIVPTLSANEALVAADRGAPDALVEQLLGRLWDVIPVPEHAALAALVMVELPRFPAAAEIYYRLVIVRWRRTFQAALERAAAAGQFPACQPIEALSWAIPSMITGAVLHLQGVGRLLLAQEPGALADRTRGDTIALLMAGLRAGTLVRGP